MSSPELAAGNSAPEAPDTGQVCAHGVRLSSAVHWVEDGEHIIRSTEFDLIASGPTLDDAVNAFVDNAEDHVRFIGDLVRQERATEHEVEVASTLMQRFLTAYEHMEDELREAYRLRHLLSSVRHPRRGRRSTRHRSRGRYQSSRPNSSPAPAA
jgi:hypothetical protein